MKKITLLFAVMLFAFMANAQFTTGEVALSYGMSVKMDTDASQVTLTLKGPTNKWFAVGFGGQEMGAVTDVFLYDGTNVFDKTGHTYAAPTNDTTQDWTIDSNTISGATRTIIATRNLSGSDSSDYTFSNSSSAIPIIYAHGSSMTLEYHQNRNFTNLSRTAVADVNKEKQIQFAMYPNPVQTELNIVLPSSIQSAQVEIYSILGKKISTKKLNTSFNKMNVSNLNSGIYLIKIIGSDNTFGVKQFVKK